MRSSMTTACRLALAAATYAFVIAGASAQQDDVVKIGVLTDMSGLYADIGGPARLRPPNWRSRISIRRPTA